MIEKGGFLQWTLCGQSSRMDSDYHGQMVLLGHCCAGFLILGFPKGAVRPLIIAPWSRAFASMGLLSVFAPQNADGEVPEMGLMN